MVPVDEVGERLGAAGTKLRDQRKVGRGRRNVPHGGTNGARLGGVLHGFYAVSHPGPYRAIGTILLEESLRAAS